MKFDIVCLEKEGDSGISLCEIKSMFEMLNLNKDYKNAEEALPLDLGATEVESSAIGFITREAADKLDFEYDGLRAFLSNIMNDMANENDRGMYQFNGLAVFLSRNLPPIM